MTTSTGRDGLFSSLRKLAATLLATASTRVELLANELEAQKLQALRMLLLAQAMLFFGTVGVLLVVLLAALVWWEHRLVVVGLSTTLVIAAAWLCYRALRQMVDKPEAPFSASLAELRRDVESLKAATHHANTPD